MLTVCLRTKQMIHFRNDTEKKIFELLYSFLGFLFVSYTYLSTCLTSWVYDQELDLYWLNRVEAPLLNQIPCGGLICIASVDFICWNCAFDIVICLFLDLDQCLPSSYVVATISPLICESVMFWQNCGIRLRKTGKKQFYCRIHAKLKIHSCFYELFWEIYDMRS